MIWCDPFIWWSKHDRSIKGRTSASRKKGFVEWQLHSQSAQIASEWNWRKLYILGGDVTKRHPQLYGEIFTWPFGHKMKLSNSEGKAKGRICPGTLLSNRIPHNWRGFPSRRWRKQSTTVPFLAPKIKAFFRTKNIFGMEISSESPHARSEWDGFYQTRLKFKTSMDFRKKNLKQDQVRTQIMIHPVLNP